MRKQFYHHGYNVVLLDDSKKQYAVSIGGKQLVGTLVGIKQSIEWFTQTKIIKDPNSFEKQEFNDPMQTQRIDHRGVKIVNDSPGDQNAWYMMFHGQLYQGSLAKLKSFVDKNS